ncbi:hypothetical protein VitviT2T_014117 [Vitis vinifera]|uniref:CCHC-type domain-containing protein n=1 Tax=Vitis vinifera TaxID=29760 RepID=A0ABY9CJM3_VITVI|nr:hypothetical protein VitviT2T_014117 [Vitis vinifera]
MKAKEWALLDRQVLGVIMLILSRPVAHNVVKEKTITDLMKALLGMYEKPSANNKEIRQKDAGETSRSGYALNLETRGRGNDRNSNRGRSKSINSNQNRSKSRLDQQVQCWICGKTGHFSRQCKSLKKKNEDDSDNAVIEEVHDVLLLAVDSPLDDWVLDSGASFHTTPHQEIIQNYVVGDFGKVYLDDGSTLDVVGLGDVRISLPNGSVWFLEKVRYIPDLKRNLIFVGQLDDEGHAILFVGGIDSRKSTTGFFFTLGGTTISWASTLQKIVTLSTTEAEYVAATKIGKEMIWLHGFLDELDLLTKGVTIEKLKLCTTSIGLLA